MVTHISTNCRIIVSNSIISKLFLTELHRLNGLLFINLYSEHRQTCANQNYLSFLIDNKLNFVSKQLMVWLKVHLTMLLPFKQEEAIPSKIHYRDLIDISDLSVTLP